MPWISVAVINLCGGHVISADLPIRNVKDISGLILEMRAAQIQSPNYPRNYNDYAFYSWQLGWTLAGDYQRLNVTLLTFSVSSWWLSNIDLNVIA